MGGAPKRRIAVTGASGIVGRHVVAVRKLGRRSGSMMVDGLRGGTAQGLVVVRFGEHHNMQCGRKQRPQDVVVGSWYRIPDACWLVPCSPQRSRWTSWRATGSMDRSH